MPPKSIRASVKSFLGLPSSKGKSTGAPYVEGTGCDIEQPAISHPSSAQDATWSAPIVHQNRAGKLGDKAETSSAIPGIPLLSPSNHSDPASFPHSLTSGPATPVDSVQATSFFSNANHFTLGAFNYAPQTLHIDSNQATHGKGWEALLQNVAPNALYNSGHRFDPPKCDEDTRVEVIGEIMSWVRDRDSPQRLLCMTGAAGAGKSALQQTISERCAQSCILASTFFFSTADATRNNLSAFVPTIAYQLGLVSDILRQSIGAAVEQDPIIFSKSLGTQMNTLVVHPLERYRSKGQDIKLLPYAILIDGLDECVVEDQQAELLATIKKCLLDTKMPYRIFIASRPEWAIHTALKDTGYLHEAAYHIPLSDKFDATNDIRRALWRRLRDIGKRSGDPRALSHLWPTEGDIELLVRAASGQFIYAATVIKFVSERRSSPVDRLKRILTWSPDGDQRVKPFAGLDLLYTNILANAKAEYDAIDTNQHDFLLLLNTHIFNSKVSLYKCGRSFDLPILDHLLSLEDGAHIRLISDLRSLITLRTNESSDPGYPATSYESVEFYHRTFLDFMGDETRAKGLYVSRSNVVEYYMQACLQTIRHPPHTPSSYFPDVSAYPWDYDSDEPASIDRTVTRYSFSCIMLSKLCAILEDIHQLPGTVDALLRFTDDKGWEKLYQWTASSASPTSRIPTGSDLGYYKHKWMDGWQCFTALMLRIIDAFQDQEPRVIAVAQTYYEKWMQLARRDKCEKKDCDWCLWVKERDDRSANAT